jgi:PAS domain S-box-containing protein
MAESNFVALNTLSSAVSGNENSLNEVSRPELDTTALETALLWKIGHLIASSMLLEDVVHTALEGVINSVGCDLALFFVRKDEDLHLKSMAPINSEVKLDATATHRLGECLCGLAARSGEPIYCFDIVCDPRCTWQECKNAGLRSFAAIPMKNAGEVLGILGLASVAPRDFENQAKFLETLAAEISIGLKNSLLHERALRHATALEREITERRRAEEELRHSEAQLRAFVQHAPYGITRASISEDRFLSVNPAAVRMLGYDSEAEVLALKLSRDLYCDPDGRREFLAQLPVAGDFSGREMHWRRKDGKPIIVRASGRVDQGPNGADDKIIEGIEEDVTQERRLEEELRQAQKMEVVGRLAGGVAHDFNNLLGVVLGYCGLLANELPPESPVLKRLEPITAAAERATALIAQLLAFNRRQPLVPKVLDLNLVISETGKILRRLIGEDIELKLVLLPNLWATMADPGQIGQLIMNLAVNARDAMPGVGTLTLETRNVEFNEDFAYEGVTIQAGRYVLLSMTDTGVGMDAATKARVFEPFFTTKPEGKGTGLGLATVYSIVTQAGGYVLVESELGKGTTFKVYLPRVEGAVDAAGVKEATDLPRGSETILLVEDTLALREFLFQGLQALGYNVLVAANSQQALELAQQREGPLHLLLTDIIMPHMSGPDLAQQLTALRPEAQVLYMSGYSNDALTRFQLTSPAAFIQKPFALHDLAKKMREIFTSAESN